MDVSPFDTVRIRYRYKKTGDVGQLHEWFSRADAEVYIENIKDNSVWGTERYDYWIVPLESDN